MNPKNLLIRLDGAGASAPWRCLPLLLCSLFTTALVACGGGGGVVTDPDNLGRLAISHPLVPQAEVPQSGSVPVSVAIKYKNKDENPLNVTWSDGGAGGTFDDVHAASTIYRSPTTVDNLTAVLGVTVSSKNGESVTSSKSLTIVGSAPTAQAEPTLDGVGGRAPNLWIDAVVPVGRAEPFLHVKWHGFGVNTAEYSGSKDFPVSGDQASIELVVKPGYFALDIEIVNGYLELNGKRHTELRGWSLLKAGANSMEIGVGSTDQWYGWAVAESLIGPSQSLVPLVTAADVQSAVTRYKSNLGSAMSYLVDVAASKKLKVVRLDASGNDPISLSPASAHVFADADEIEGTIPLINQKACWYAGTVTQIGSAQYSIDGVSSGGAVIRGGRLYIPPKSKTDVRIHFRRGDGLWFSVNRAHSLDAAALNIIDSLWMAFGPTSRSFASLPRDTVQEIADAIADAAGHGELKLVRDLNELWGFIERGDIFGFGVKFGGMLLDGAALDATSTAISRVFQAAGQTVSAVVVKGYLTKIPNLFAALQGAVDNWTAKQSTELSLSARVPGT